MKNHILNTLDLFAIILISVASYAAITLQITHHELPCSLCVMQRLGLYTISFGLILNLIKKRDIKHNLLVILTSLITAFIALLQVLRHIVPGSGSYGDALFGMHLYTWTFILCIAFVIYSTITALLSNTAETATDTIFVRKITILVISLLMLSLAINLISTFAECGPYLCPSDPDSYWIKGVLTK